MYKRDVGILIISAFAIYFSVQHEGPFAFRKAWYYHLDEADDNSATLPPPIVADLNGDGSSEVIISTHDCRIKVLVPKGAGRAGDGFANAVVLAEISLLPTAWPSDLMKAKRAIAFSTGYLDRKPSESVFAPRKQVLVVVLADWTVVCMDHNLRVMWNTQIMESVEGPYGWATMHAHVKEVAIHISNHTVRKGDRGLVVIGGSVDLGDLRDDDVLESELQAEQEEDTASSAVPRNKPTKDTWRIGGVDISKHFSYYAVDGATGQSRWTHEGQDFHQDSGHIDDQVIPQHNYRLDAKSAAGRHSGEAACRDFRESVLRILPHRWQSREDTRLQLAHFERHRHQAGERKSSLAANAKRGQRASTSAQLPAKQGLDHRNPIARLMGKAAQKAQEGGAAVHTSQRLDSLPPNALVAYLEGGIEVVHMYTGRTICKLHLPPGGLHTDLNADGIPDHIKVVGESHVGHRHSDRGHRHGHSCWVSATSGIPATMPFFNGSICHYGFRFGDVLGSMGQTTGKQAPLEIAPPAVLPSMAARAAFNKGSGQIVFLNNHGEMTSLDSHGGEMWRYSFGVSWENWEGEQSWRRIVPTLKTIALRAGGLPTTILASGAFQAVIASERGHVLERIDLPGPPRLALLAEDFNADGLTDILLVTHSGVFGFAQLRRPGGVPFSALLGLLIVAMIFVYATHQAGPQVAKKGRSTDRVD